MDNPSAPVTIYSAPWCVFCRMVKQYLDARGVAYKEIDVDKDQDTAKAIVEKTGQAGVPVIEIGDETILGFDRQRIDEALRDKKLV
jgi:glutaredoxin 3